KMGGSASTSDPITRVSVGAHPEYDRFVIEFAGQVPKFGISHAGTSFTLGPSGRSAAVEGRTALVLKLSGIDWTAYSGPNDLKPEYANLKEARLAENFEGYQVWMLGLAGSDCYRV